MFNRPRCRDWSPLATQQLRLRNLIQITGHNIVANAKTSIYFTLHLTTMSSPFYTSDHLESFKNVFWPEINCQCIQKSTSKFVCVRVWQHQSHENDEQQLQQINSSGTKSTSDGDIVTATSDDSRCEKPNRKSNDKIVFVWGVYLSGLVPITKRSDIKLRDNSLVFYMHGGFFTSAEYLMTDCIPKQYINFYRAPRSTQNRNVNEKAAIPIVTHLRNCDQRNPQSSVSSSEYSKSPSRNFSLIARSSDEFVAKKSSNQLMTIAKSIQNSNYDETTCSGCDCECDLANPNVLKIRFIEKEFFKLEVRRSYDVKKLLALQEKQRIYRNRTMDSKELIEKICMKSAFCLNLKLIANKGMLYRPRANPSIGRTLNRLLATQVEQPKPEDLVKAQELRRKIETAKFRCRILTMERDRHKINLRKLQEKCTALSDENIDKESWLMASYRELSRNRELAIEQNSMFMLQQRLNDRLQERLCFRQKQLLAQLKQIYTIECEGDVNRIYKINGIYLPNANAYMESVNTTHGSLMTSSSICVALGYVGHIILMLSRILNVPLR